VTQVRAVEAAAEVLGLRIVRSFDESMFGAALVEGRGSTLAVLKASTDLTLAPAWATGAAMATRLRECGYPASNYLETGTTETVTWSLQAVLPGHVPAVFSVGHAEQLVALAQRHDIDAGMQQPWGDIARDISRRALADLAPLPDRFDETLRAVVDGTDDVRLAQTTIVHGDFHHRNFLVDDAGRVTGVFDWDIAGPGDWRFDLVNLAFACQMYPKTCEADALGAVIAAVHEHCDAPTAAFLTACQTLRALSMLKSRHVDWVEPASRRMRATLVEWWS
jgi:aminoglycoside phosphotransferase (APT) family kinase protein